ncbi:MAG TPA: RICIN domain-containing protein [Pyrinomonadaceae bacterium]
MKITASIFGIVVTLSGNSYGQTTPTHHLVAHEKIVIKNKASGNVLSSVITAGTQVRQVEYTGGSSQHFRLQEAGNETFRIVSENNLFLSLKVAEGEVSGGETSTSSSGKLVLDQRFLDNPACATTAILRNCPVNQVWKISPVSNESQAFTIESMADNVVLQPQSNAARSLVFANHSSGADNQKWILVARDDLALLPLATSQEISEFEDIVANQSGVAVRNGDTTKPIYFHHNNGADKFFEYRKKFFAPGFGEESVIAWAPVNEVRRTFCGRVLEYKQQKQDLEHDGTFSLDVDATLHLEPNSKFGFMLKNPKMESYVKDRYFKEQMNIACSVSNCNIPAIRKLAEDRARAGGQELLRKFNTDNIEVEFTPAMLGNPIDSPSTHFLRPPLNPMFSFRPINLGKNVCAYGPWMWERLFIDDLPAHAALEAAGFEDFFNNEIHPANQIWFRENGTLNLIAVVDQTGYFENPRNPGNNTEVNASGLGQRMRFHVAFKIPARVLNGEINKVVEYQVNGIGFHFTNNSAVEVSEIVQSLKHRDIVRLQIRDNSFLKSERTHRVFLEELKSRPDGSIQGYLVIETQPITRRGGSINVFVKDQ